MTNMINTEIIRNKRIEKGLPQRKVGAMLNIDQSSISNIEHGKKELRFSEAVKLAEFLEISISDLVRKQV
jgi:transcriptional regulator with XRE-family HTH domain